jgi:hypothetical protein
MDINNPEPTIMLDKTVSQKPAKTDRYIIQIARRAISKLANKIVRVVLHDKEAFHTVLDKTQGVPVYEFEVNFSDEDESKDLSDVIGTGIYPPGSGVSVS